MDKGIELKNSKKKVYKRKNPIAFKRKAFTLAEVLITLAIIGVVSALVIPSVLKNYNDKKYNTARLKALKTFGEAGKMASINGEINGQPTARAFVENVLSKYLKITKVCDTAEECNFPTTIKGTSGTNKASSGLRKWSQIGFHNRTNNNYTAIDEPGLSTYASTIDGYSTLIHYNPKCAKNSREVTLETNCIRKDCSVYNIDIACMNVIYDMNGIKKPNHVGDDIGIVTIFWSGLKTTSVAPSLVPYSINNNGQKVKFVDAPSICTNKSTKKDIYRTATVDEISSLYINNNLTSMQNSNYWAGSFGNSTSNQAWVVGNGYGDGKRAGLRRIVNINSGTYRTWCVKE